MHRELDARKLHPMLESSEHDSRQNSRAIRPFVRCVRTRIVMRSRSSFKTLSITLAFVGGALLAQPSFAIGGLIGGGGGTGLPLVGGLVGGSGGGGLPVLGGGAGRLPVVGGVVDG